MLQGVLLWVVDDRLAQAKADNDWSVEPPYIVCKDMLYADDTLRLSGCAAKLKVHMDCLCLVDEGRGYGLELNWEPSGEPMKRVDRVVYLGCLLTACPSAAPEVSRRLGKARQSFNELARY